MGNTRGKTQAQLREIEIYFNSVAYFRLHTELQAQCNSRFS
jgi:hypothetical protein